MDTFLQYTILGLVTGGVYGIAASGLVVTYTTSGIFNFAHGAVAMLSAFTYWQAWTPPTSDPAAVGGTRRYAVLAHTEPRPDGSLPRYAPAEPETWTQVQQALFLSVLLIRDGLYGDQESRGWLVWEVPRHAQCPVIVEGVHDAGAQVAVSVVDDEGVSGGEPAPACVAEPNRSTTRWPDHPRGTRTVRWYQTSPTYSYSAGSGTISLKLDGTGMSRASARGAANHRSPRPAPSGSVRNRQSPSRLFSSRVGLSWGRSMTTVLSRRVRLSRHRSLPWRPLPVVATP